jgi:penicillin-binding protein 1C
MRKDLDKGNRATSVGRRLAILLSCFFVVATALIFVPIRYLPRETLQQQIASSTAVFDRKGRLLRLTLARDEQYRLWTPLEAVSPEFVEALLLHEDGHFYRHLGFNPFAFVRAAFSTYGGGPRVGGSTLTMQLARLKYGLNTRTIPGKLEQIARAIQLELMYSKHDLLEAHLNLMPYGGNVQGVGTASLVYFDKRADRLDIAESLALVVIPQSPLRRTPDGEEPAELRAARERLFERWVEKHAEDESLRASLAQPLRFARIEELPFAAPHFVNHVLRVSAFAPTPTLSRSTGVGIAPEALGPSPSSVARERSLLRDLTPATFAHPVRQVGMGAAPSTIISTLDLPLQRLTERVLHNYVRERSGVGIHNAAALLVDTRGMSVRAMVGSANFHSPEIFGQVNGTLAKRSPGSALKPFIYALAIDQGVIHPLTVLKDAPTSFGPFSPENFDGRFVGPITASDALIRSRNIPAIALSGQLAQPSFYQFLKSAGVANMASERHYGLALALGGGEITMEETAALYSMLANRGELAPLRYLESQDDARVRMLSEEAAFMTLDMLKSAARPDDPVTRKQDRVRTAWKTGTSWGFRDAWTAGVFGQYVLVVWVGNFDGQSNPAFVGVQAAAPLFFRLVDAIAVQDTTLVEPAFRQPARLARVEVCSASGDLPNTECPQTSTTWYIPGVSPIRISDIHRRVWIDTRTGEQACPPFDPTHARSEVFEYWPSELMQLFAQAGMPRRRPPEAAVCQRDVPVGTAPRITSPVTSVTYTLRAQRLGDESIPLAANTDSEARRVHWFVDEAYVGSAAPGIALGWQPAHAGKYVVRAVDDRGRADSRELDVTVVN